VTKQLLIQRLKEIGVVHQQPVHLSHAGTSDIYFSIKDAYGYPDARQCMSEVFWELILADSNKAQRSVTCVAAIGYGGIPPASDLSLNYDWKLTLIRDEPKQRGLEKQIEGYQPTPDDLVAIIDDVCTTGATLQKAVDIIQTTGATVLGCYVLVKRGKTHLSVPLRYVLTPKDLL